MSPVDPDPIGEDPPAKPAPAQAPSKKRRRQAGIQVDGYKIKADIRPAEVGEPAPRTWREVGAAVNAKLMKIAVDTFGVLGDSLEGLRKCIRGLAEIPAAFARRVDRAHERADRLEGTRQEKLEARQLPPPDTTRVVDQLEGFLRQLQSEGIPVEVRELEDGTPAIVIVRPELQSVAARATRAALPSPDSAAAGTAGLLVETFLSARVAGILQRRGIRTAGDLAAPSVEDLLAGDGFGEKSLVAVREALVRLGLNLRGE
jgi:hypothetical protein